MKKSKLIKLFAILLVILISNSASFAQFGGGNGTQMDPYKITSRADMEALADSVDNSPLNNTTTLYNWSRGKYFILVNDITDSVRTIVGTIGNGEYAHNPGTQKRAFQGDFNGNSKKITLAIVGKQNFINGSWVTITGGNIGLFAAVYAGRVYDLAVDGYAKGDVMVGGICGVLTDGTISNCINYVNITCSQTCGGGIVGDMNRSTLTNCRNYGNIIGYGRNVGGICGVSRWRGFTTNDAFLDCHNYGNVSCEHAAGGIAGDLLRWSTLSYCTNSGDITGSYFVGGIAGHLRDSVIISHCINIGTVRGDSVVGGIATGWDEHYTLIYGNYGYIHSCHNAGLVIGKSIVGGIQARCWGKISNSLNTGVVIGEKNVGGIAGLAGNPNINTSEIFQCHYDIQMFIYNGIGGYDGYLTDETSTGQLTRWLIGNNLENVLSATDWTFNNANLYPTLKYFEGDSVALVASSPVYLYDSDIMQLDQQNSVKSNFKVNLENDVKWDRMIGNVDIVNDDGLLRNSGSDTLVCSIGNYKKLVPINIELQPKEEIDTFLLTLHANPEDGGSVTGAGKYVHDTLASISATANPCYQFVNWTDSTTGKIVSENATHEFRFPNNNLTLIANFVRDSFDLALAVNPANAGKASGGGRFACGDDTYHTIEAVPSDACFAFKNWTDENGNVISESAKDSVIVAKNTVLTANFSNVCDIHFTIWATEHKLVAPSRRNYRIPIYIKSNEDVPADLFAINKLVIEIDNRVFYPKRTNIGTLAGKNQNEITIENIKIPALNAGEEVMLFYLIGDMLLGTIDSSEIIINQNIEFAGDFNGSPEVTNGSITLNICREGSDRFVEVAGNSPSLTIKNNPVEDILEVECNVLESGRYTLEVVDMAGGSVKVKEFVAGGIGAFGFEIDAKQFSSGRYMVVLVAPNGRRFVENMVKE